jgi:hypothetical protein
MPHATSDCLCIFGEKTNDLKVLQFLDLQSVNDFEETNE